VSEIDKPITLVIETYKSAVYKKEVETFMHLYDPGVRVFDTWGVWSYEGAAAWQRAVEGWFTSLGSERFRHRQRHRHLRRRLGAGRAAARHAEPPQLGPEDQRARAPDRS